MASYWDTIWNWLGNNSSSLIGAGATLGGAYLAGQGQGGGSITSYQSPEQQAVYAAMVPLMQKVSQAGMSGQSPYNIPNPEMLMPGKDWYSSLSPEVMQGIRAPYEDASKQLTESLGYSAGSAMGGASGTLGGAQAKFWEEAGKGMGQQAWGMVQPAYSAGWQALLQGQQMPFNMMPGMMGGSYSQPVIQPDTSFNWGNALMGGMGAYGISQMFNPWGQGEKEKNA